MIATLEKTPKKEKVKAPSPKVSVIIPVYNVADYIAETLDSVLAQTFRDLEILVINDGSPDTEKLEQALAPYFGKIIYLKQPNSGAAAARNTGIRTAQGEILAFLDGDDIWLPEYLEKQIAFLGSTGSDMVYCDAYLFGDKTKYKTFMEKAPTEGEVTTESLLRGTSHVITSGTIVLREKVLEVGMFDIEAPKRGEDFNLWFHLLKDGKKVACQREVLLKYRLRAGSLTGDSISVAARSMHVLEEVKRKYDLTPGEKEARQYHYDRAAAQFNVQSGKARLVAGKYSEALKFFREAKKTSRSLKLSVITALTWAFPTSARWSYRTFRPEEAGSFTVKKQ
ncbi:MAG TPA: glycosyltransferase family 2 protein [Pyrinomonadaceae bacterium]|jgi:glycosyltransferase involved in cell wall biosynthesis|nr:glycosyltransferase family 2 protein [Pyrinomonadaceae bacterium]